MNVYTLLYVVGQVKMRIVEKVTARLGLLSSSLCNKNDHRDADEDETRPIEFRLHVLLPISSPAADNFSKVSPSPCRSFSAAWQDPLADRVFWSPRRARPAFSSGCRRY